MDIVYVATGEKFFDEALLSIESVKRTCPGVHVTLYSDKEWRSAPGVSVRILDSPCFGYRDKIVALNDFAGRDFVFLDSDTYVLSDVRDLFELFERFDMFGVVCEVRQTPGTFFPEVPTSYPEINTGMLGFKNVPEVAAFLKRWLVEHDSIGGRERNVPDQPAFRKAIYESGIRFATLGAEFNFRLPFCGYVEQEVRVLHGRRTKAQFERLGRVLNTKLGPRVFFPRTFVLRQEAWLIEKCRPILRVLKSL